MAGVLQWYSKRRSVAVPATPGAPVPSDVVSTGVTLSWAAVPTSTFYTLERSVDDVTYAVVYTGSPLTFDDTGLSATTLYYYRLQASSGVGDSDYSATTIVTLDASSPPATPAAPTVDSVTTTTASLSWSAVALASSYTLERSTLPTSGFSGVFTGSALTFIDSGLTAGTDYYYRLSASNADGTSAASTATLAHTTGATTIPATPAQPTSSNITSGSVNIAWVAVSGATDYELQRRQTVPSVTAFATVYGPNSGVSFADTGLSASTTYEYKVRASNSAGASSYSTVRTVVTAGLATNIQPVSALYLRQNSGIATHPNFNTSGSVFKSANATQIVARIANAGFGFMRGQYSFPTIYGPEIRKFPGMKWIMGVATEGSTHPTDQTVAETRSRVREIREQLADICGGIEGINEPNQNRGAGDIVANWADETVDHQRAIWQEAKWNLTSVNGPIGSSATAGAVLNPLRNIKIFGPSLHDVACENSYDGTANTTNGGPRHWHQLLDLGILNVQDAAGFHCYPGAGIPLRGARNRALLGAESESGNVTGRLELMWSAYGDRYPSYTTEWGYHNALADTVGHLPIDERGSGIYYPRGFIQFITKPYRINGSGLENNTACTGFELLDDQDDGPKNFQESNFGVLGYDAGTDATVPANWRNKAQYDSAKTLFTHFTPEPLDTTPYTPARISCSVSTTAANDNLEWQFIANKAQSDAGTATIAIYRNMKVWNRVAQTVVNVSTIPVTITDRVGARTIQVGAPVTLLDLR